MSEHDEDTEDRSFERWALAGACVLALAGVAAFLVRRDADSGASSADAERDADLLRVRIGGQRPAPSDPDANPDDLGSRVAPDPAPPGPEPIRVPPPPPPPEPPRTIVVQPGETLGQIAQRELGTVRRLPEILELNGIEDPDLVRAGTTLRLPPR